MGTYWKFEGIMSFTFIFIVLQVVDRLSHHCGELKKATAEQIAIFQLGVGDGCIERVRALMENDVYVYPGQWANDKDGKVTFFLFII